MRMYISIEVTTAGMLLGETIGGSLTATATTKGGVYPEGYLLQYRDEIRFAHHALISGRQMFIRAGTMSIFLVAMTKKGQFPPSVEPPLVSPVR